MASPWQRGAAALAVTLAVTTASAQVEATWDGSGDIQSLLLRSRDAAGAAYALDHTRLRLKAQGRIGDSLRVDLQYDNELWLGGHVRTAAFRQERAAEPLPYWTLQSIYADRGDAYGRHRIHRAFVSLAAGATDLRFGRQRVAWGNGRFWSPLDRLNPPLALALDRRERAGVDALLVEHRIGAASHAAGVYAPGHEAREAALAVRWHGNAGGVEHSLVAGRFRREKLIGLDATGQVGGAILRAEAAWVESASGARSGQWLAGVDMAPAEGLTLGAEVYRDGSGATRIEAYDLAAVASGQRQSLARHYAGLLATLELTPLLIVGAELVVNLDDRSRYLAPSITWSWRANLDATLGWQSFGGRAGTEFARPENVLYARLRWYF